MKKYALICLTVLLVCLAAGCAKPVPQDSQAAQDILPTLAPETSPDPASSDAEATVEATGDRDETNAPTVEAEPETEAHVTGEPVEAPAEPGLDLQWGRTWRSEQADDPEKGALIRELTLNYDESDFYFRAGEPNSEYFYFVRGTWSLDGDRLHLEGIQLDEFDNVLPDASKVEAGYTVVIEDGKLILTNLGEATALLEDPGTPIVFELKEETDD